MTSASRVIRTLQTAEDCWRGKPCASSRIGLEADSVTGTLQRTQFCARRHCTLNQDIDCNRGLRFGRDASNATEREVAWQQGRDRRSSFSNGYRCIGDRLA
jgi:hypothetical protein